MSPYACIAVVTGANRQQGIGLACVRQLALQYPASKFNRGPGLLIYLTARTQESGEAAVRTVTQQLDDAAAAAGGGAAKGRVDVQLRLLDLESESSIASFAASLAADGVDILINNSAVLLDVEGAALWAVERTMRCNFFGTLALTQALLPCMRDGGRVVNVSSVAGLLSFGEHFMYSDEVKNGFLRAEKVEDVTGLARQYVAAVEKGTWESSWPPSSYCVSKAAMIGMTKVLAKQLAQTKRHILINSCCPGNVKTDMNNAGQSHPIDGPNAPLKTPDEGAKTPVLLALGDIHGTSGEFWRDEAIMEWDYGASS